MFFKKYNRILSILCIFLLGVQSVSADEFNNDPTNKIVAGMVGLIGSAVITYILRKSFIDERDSFPRSRYSLVSRLENCHGNQDIENQPLANDDVRPIFNGKCVSTYYFLLITIWSYTASGVLLTRGFVGL